jgi:hypothetical protein
VNIDLVKKLRKDFPIFFAKRTAFGREFYTEISCGDGWEHLVRSVAQRVEEYNKTSSTPIQAAQIKEKFGTLRLYVDEVPTELMDEVNKLVSDAEIRSQHYCEDCGSQEDVQTCKPNGFWIRTVCGKCRKEKSQQ